MEERRQPAHGHGHQHEGDKEGETDDEHADTRGALPGVDKLNEGLADGDAQGDEEDEGDGVRATWR